VEVNKELTQHWLGRFQQTLKELENGPVTLFTELQKDFIIWQIKDLEKQLAAATDSTSTEVP
jgi:hypothetical protein